MKTKMWILPAMTAGMMVAAAACTSAQFGTRTQHKADGAVDPNGSNTAPTNPPLDVSGLNGNKANNPNGPSAGTGAVDARTIELDCDQSQGISINVASSPTATWTGTATDTSVNTGKGYDPTQPSKLALLGDPSYAPVDKNGNPVDANGNPVSKDGGKDGGKPLPVQPPQATPPTANVVTTVKGRFCPKAQAALTVLFVVDYSGSMGLHVDNFGGPTLPGNDPQVNGSCGRLVAAQAVLSKIQAVLQGSDNVQVGLVPFAGGVVTNKVIALTDFASFQALATKDTFCQYVVQDAASQGVDPANPGGIDGTSLGINAATNYVAAFNAAQSLLGSVYGQKQIYFISDGEPTLPGDGGNATPLTVSASVAAGAALRAAVDNLTFHAVLLQNAELGTQAPGILAQVAGSASQVLLASDATDLANQITAFPDPSIDPTTGKATLTVAPYPGADLGLQYLQQDPANPGQWIYLTQPFDLEGTPGQTVQNLVTVTAAGNDGTTYQATIQINYTQ